MPEEFVHGDSHRWGNLAILNADTLLTLSQGSNLNQGQIHISIQRHWENLENHLADTRAQVNELHLVGLGGRDIYLSFSRCFGDN